MNLLAIDYGIKRIGLAISVLGIITPITPISNDDQKFNSLIHIIDQYKIEKIFVGISEGEFAKTTQKFVDQLRNMIRCDIETVEEAVSTIEADQIFLDNNK